MKYVGTRLRQYLSQTRGGYKDLASKMLKYRKPRKNASPDKYNLAPLFSDGHNITIDTLSALMRETGLPIDFFIDFEAGEMPIKKYDGINGNNNVINSSISNDLTLMVDHLNEVIRLKNELINDKERIINLKDAEIDQWKKRHDNRKLLAKSNEKKQ